MTVIRPNSISGVTSITAQSQSIEFYKSDGNLSGANLDGVNINTAGILTAANFKTGSSNLHSTGLTVGNNFLHSTGINVGTGATIHVPSSNVLTLGTNNNERIRITSDGNLGLGDNNPPNFTGYTSLSIHGSTGGALVFGDDGTDEWEIYGGDGVIKIYDRANTQERIRISDNGAIGLGGANYGSSGQVLTSGGSGSAATWSTVSGTNIVNNASGRLVVGSNTANTLDAKPEATYNGTKLLLTGGVGQDQHIPMLELKHLNTAYSSGNGDGPALLLNGYYASNEWALAKIAAVNAGGQYGGGYAGGLQFWVHPANGTQTASVIKGAEIIGNNGGADLYITDGDIKVASGHGIDFSATSNSGGTMSSEVLDDYEEGSWTPTLVNAPSGASIYSATGYYTKVGNMCTIWLQGPTIAGNNSSNNIIQIGGIPFSCASNIVATGIPRGYGVYRNSNHTWVTMLDSGNNIMWGQLDENVSWTMLKYSGLQNTSGHVTFQITLTYKTT